MLDKAAQGILILYYKESGKHPARIVSLCSQTKPSGEELFSRGVLLLKICRIVIVTPTADGHLEYKK